MKSSKILAGVSSLYLASASAVNAASGFLPDDKTSAGSIQQIIKTVLNFAIGFAVIVCVVVLIFAGYSYMTAAGDENKIQKATTSLTWAIVGLILCFVAVLLVKFVGEKVLGVDPTTIP